MKYLFLSALLILLAACTGLKLPAYSVDARNSKGQPLSKRAGMHSNTAGVETARRFGSKMGAWVRKCLNLAAIVAVKGNQS